MSSNTSAIGSKRRSPGVRSNFDMLLKEILVRQGCRLLTQVVENAELGVGVVSKEIVLNERERSAATIDGPKSLRVR